MELILVLEDNNPIIEDLIKRSGLKRGSLCSIEGEKIVFSSNGYEKVNRIPTYTNHVVYNCRKDFRKFLSLAVLISKCNKIVLNDFINPKETTTELTIIDYGRNTDNIEKLLEKEWTKINNSDQKVAISLFNYNYVKCGWSELDTFRSVFDADLVISLQNYNTFKDIFTRKCLIQLTGNNFTIKDVKQYIYR